MEILNTQFFFFQLNIFFNGSLIYNLSQRPNDVKMTSCQRRYNVILAPNARWRVQRNLIMSNVRLFKTVNVILRSSWFVLFKVSGHQIQNCSKANWRREWGGGQGKGVQSFSVLNCEKLLACWTPTGNKLARHRLRSVQPSAPPPPLRTKIPPRCTKK